MPSPRKPKHTQKTYPVRLGQKPPVPLSILQIHAVLVDLQSRRAWQEILMLTQQLGDTKYTDTKTRFAFFSALEHSQQRQALLKETQQALAQLPRNPEILSWNAHALRINGQLAPSVDVLRKAIKHAPPSAELFNALGSALKELGEFQEAIQWLQKSIALNPKYAAAYWNLSDLEPDATAAIQRITGGKDPKHIENALLNFCMYRHHDKLGNTGDAFKFLRKANALQKQKLPYARSEATAMARQITEVFKHPPAPSNAQHPPKFTPIFIFGLPRSGTTLVEQIICAHPNVIGGNELSFLNDASLNLQRAKRIPGTFPRWLQNLEARDWERLGAHYMNRAASLMHDAKTHLTDKSLMNFKAAGLIANALPHAKMLHLQRAPMDVGFGIFRQYFGDGMAFANDFQDIAHALRDHRELSDHWQTVLPSSMYQQVNYETLVNNPKHEIARILDFCELSPDPHCFTPETNQRVIRTLSAIQVREPIHNRGVNAWQKYAHELSGLATAIDDLGLTHNTNT